jgi:hypothetical protein
LLVIGATLVLVSVVLFLFGGFTPLTRLGLHLGAGFLIFGVTIVLDEHLRRKEHGPRRVPGRVRSSGAQSFARDLRSPGSDTVFRKVLQ